MTSVTAGLQINGEARDLKLNGSIGGDRDCSTPGRRQNNSLRPQVNLTGKLEAIEKFAYIDAQAYVSQTFMSPSAPSRATS